MPSVRDRLERALTLIDDPAGEGSRAFIEVTREVARAQADAADARRRQGVSLGPLDGVIVSIKDLFDVAAEKTRAGSILLNGVAPAATDCPAVARLRAAGAVFVGRTNMSEFAFHAMGTNPHFGTPGNVKDRTRVPGGSSSGAGVSVADGMCDIGLGSDTAGSIRVPAALNGIVGFKPTQKRVPLEGAFPLSFTLDSAGPLARSVADAHAADAVLTNEAFAPLVPADVAGLRFAVPKGGFPLEALDATVGPAFEAALRRLSAAGARLVEVPLPVLDGMIEVQSSPGFSPAEAFYIHEARLDASKHLMDPVVAARAERGRGVSAAKYLWMHERRRALIREMDAVLEPFDALLMPTAPIAAPEIAEVLQSLEAFLPRTLMLIRNPVIGSFFDLCSASVPMPVSGLAAGLMITARHMHDRRLFRVAAGVERLFAA